MHEAEVVIKFIAPDGNPAIVIFEARVKGGSSDQSCTIRKLHPAREYVIAARACLPKLEGCSAEIEKIVWTMPPGTLVSLKGLYKTLYLNIFSKIAPLAVKCDEVTPSTAIVMFVQPADTSGIDHYYGMVKNESMAIDCEVMADAEPLQCELAGLTPSLEYVVSGYACLAGSLGCGAAAEGSLWTPPMGTLAYTNTK